MMKKATEVVEFNIVNEALMLLEEQILIGREEKVFPLPNPKPNPNIYSNSNPNI